MKGDVVQIRSASPFSGRVQRTKGAEGSDSGSDVTPSSCLRWKGLCDEDKVRRNESVRARVKDGRGEDEDASGEEVSAPHSERMNRETDPGRGACTLPSLLTDNVDASWATRGLVGGGE